MGYKHNVFTLACDGNKAEIQDAIDDFLAGVNFHMWYLSLEGDESGPEAPDAPIISAALNGLCSVTTTNFVAVEGVTYQLEASEHNWEAGSAVSVIKPSCGPNETVDNVPYTSNTRFRIVAYDNTGTVSGQPSSTIP